MVSFSFPSTEDVYSNVPDETLRRGWFWNPEFKTAAPFIFSLPPSMGRNYLQTEAMLPPEMANLSHKYGYRQLRRYLWLSKWNATGIFGTNSSCAVVTGDRHMEKYKYGADIDSHAVVFRLNLHQSNLTEAFGSKTTHMMVNTGFWNSWDGIYNKLYLLKNLKEFVIFNHFQHDLKVESLSPREVILQRHFSIYQCAIVFASRGQFLRRSLILNPYFVQDTYRAFQLGTGRRFTNAPSSGFTALVLLSKFCSSVSGYGFLPEFDETWHDYELEHALIRQWSLDSDASVKLRLFPPL